MENLVFIKSKMYLFIFGTSFLHEKVRFVDVKSSTFDGKSDVTFVKGDPIFVGNDGLRQSFML